jgi:hypothetical protein
MALITPPLPTIGQPRATEDVDVLNALQAILNLVNGEIDAVNIADGSLTQEELGQALRELLGVNGGGQVRRGKSIIATEETRTNVAFGTLTTPDRVQNVVLPTDGLMVVAYQAMWKASVASAAEAAIFLDNVQTVEQTTQAGSGDPLTSEAFLGSGYTVNQYKVLASWAGGLASAHNRTSTVAYNGDVATGQPVGGGMQPDSAGPTGFHNVYGPCFLFADAGAYDVSVQFRSSSGSVTAKNRKLWVWTLGF